jgi:hypothetical protein
MNKIALISLPLLATALILPLQPWASDDKDHSKDHGKAYALRQNAEVLPLQELLNRVQLPADARVLEVEYEEKRGRHLYEIEYLLPDGRVEGLKVDALSAEIIKREGKDKYSANEREYKDKYQDRYSDKGADKYRENKDKDRD